MGAFEDIVRTITDNLFSQVAILIGLVGLALQRKPIEEVAAGGMRATIGVVILNIGIDLFVGGLGNASILAPVDAARSTLEAMHATVATPIGWMEVVGGAPADLV